MSFEALMTNLQRLSVSVEAFAALGAELQLRHDRKDGDPRLRALLNDVLHVIDPQLLDGVAPDQQAIALKFSQTVFRQAHELLENPQRIAGWSVQDPEILQSQGQLSRAVVRAIEALASQRRELSLALQRPGAFLDVGTGVAWLAIEAARTWSALRVVGLDPWEPALTLARQNLAGSGVADRIELRLMPVEQLDETAAFTLAWIPGPFISAKVAELALPRVQRALLPGGWLIFGINAPPQGPLEETLAALRIVRSGGHPWTAQEVEEYLRANDYEEVETFAPALPIRLVVGRRPT